MACMMPGFTFLKSIRAFMMFFASIHQDETRRPFVTRPALVALATMNHRLALALLGALLFTAGSVPVAHAQLRGVKSDQETLIELERRWNQAFYAKDLDFLRSVLADEFVAIYDDGSRGDKARELAL